MNLDQEQIAIIGLGYVGLPLAVEFGKQRKTIGFDVSEARIKELNAGQDATLEVDRDEIENAPHLSFSSSHADLKECGVFIVAVPTPIDRANRPDLTLLKSASETVGKVISKGAVVIFESTVFPGCTREVCVPIIEKVSGLTFNRDFFAGYSPERINPGDKQHRLPNIVKVTSGSPRRLQLPSTNCIRISSTPAPIWLRQLKWLRRQKLSKTRSGTSTSR